jgi:carbonic anhydrase
MAVARELLDANARYAAGFAKGDLPMPPGRRVAVLTCMDARLDPARALGLAEGDAHVIRNAGGRASDDALRSLAISQQLLGTREVVVIHHTDCGMQTFTNDELRARLRTELGADAAGIDFLPFGDLEGSVREDVAAIRESPLVPRDVAVTGFVYDVRTGRLHEVR